MAITLADFNKIWASTSPLTPYSFSESNYKQGWNFIGSTPPARQMWDFLQKNNDEKMQYLANNYLPLSGGTLNGVLFFSDSAVFNLIQRTANGKHLAILGGNDYSKCASISLAGGSENSGTTYQGSFTIRAAKDDGTNKYLFGSPDGTLTWDGQLLLPVGVVQAFAGSTIPVGWLLCDGSAVSRTTYAGLFAVIGTTYGAGDGSTTFNLPNLVDKFIEGSTTAGTAKTAGLPSITGNVNPTFSNVQVGISSGGGALMYGESLSAIPTVTSTGTSEISGYGKYLKFDASRSSSIYGNSTTVQPPALTMKYIIKY